MRYPAQPTTRDPSSESNPAATVAARFADPVTYLAKHGIEATVIAVQDNAMPVAA